MLGDEAKAPELKGGLAMLVLARKVGERILIGDDIVVTLVSVRGNKVRIGVEAPVGMRVDREEIRRAIDRGDPPPVK